MVRLGRLSSFTPAFLGSRTAFDARLHELGWIEGKNLVIERRFSGGDLAVLQRQARELVDAKVDVIFCPTELEAEAARQVTPSIPIVAAILVHPLERGLIASYAQPGGNVTGLTWEPSAEFAEKYPELLREILPGLTLLGCLFDTSFPGLGAILVT